MVGIETELDEGNSSSSVPWYVLVYRAIRRFGCRSEQIQALAMQGPWSQDRVQRLRGKEQGQGTM